MSKISLLILTTLLVCVSGAASARSAVVQGTSFAGSTSCRECHERFYQLWSTSMHGLAMQPYTPLFAANQLTTQDEEITIGQSSYRAVIEEGVVVESDAAGSHSYPMMHVLGGKNVYYFLTPLDKGRLQTLPVAYDVRTKQWFDTAASGVRHFPGGEQGRPVSWKESPYTFNTSCHSCHVSQLSTNYDPESDIYHTTWSEPGINCETCHGPAETHNRLARATPAGQRMADPAIISTNTMTVEQRNDLCLSCHAKANPLTSSFPPGARFFDHFDPVTLEDPDYYPDGRDLGENYTYLSWSMSPCVAAGELDCMHCHTSSGRYRFKNESFNNACLPCHEEKVSSPEDHTRHAADSVGSRCVSCHMPKTSFARMERSDHSMLPPAPAASIAFGSPNACTICHEQQDDAWADALVRTWRPRDFQAPVLHRAGLVEAARKRDWSRLAEMLAYLKDPQRDDVSAASLIVLMNASADPRIEPAVAPLAADPSPLIRGAVAAAVANRTRPEHLASLLALVAGDYRFIRLRAAPGLLAVPEKQVPEQARAMLEELRREYLDFIMARPDQWTAHYNLGNYYLSRGQADAAIDAYRAALEKEPQEVMTLVNLSMAHARNNDLAQAEDVLQDALDSAPDNASAHFNMGLLQAGKGDRRQAEAHLTAALRADPGLASAAYNLCVLVAADRPGEAIDWCRTAASLQPEEPRYAFTLAYFLEQQGQTDEAASILGSLIKDYPGYQEPQQLLRKIMSQGTGQ
jgi:tetratricopeptide (TPR) repeat protein